MINLDAAPACYFLCMPKLEDSPRRQAVAIDDHLRLANGI